MQIRWWVKNIFNTLGQKGVPIIIFSAWVTNIIESVLEENDIQTDIIHGNAFDFVDGVFSIVNEGVFIGNKKWSSLPWEVHQHVSWRTHQILLWDSIGDMEMQDTERETTSIWFLLTEQQKRWDEDLYTSTFSHVVKSDTSDNGFLEKITQELIENSPSS